MTSLNIQAAQQQHPRLFKALRTAGWSEDRRVPIPDDVLDGAADLGFFPDSYQEEFLATFCGIRVDVEKWDEQGRPSYATLVVGLGDQIGHMNARDNVGYIKRIAGTSRLFPTIMSGGDAVFVLEDGRCLAIEVSFRGCAWAAEPFEMMDWLLFTVSGPGLTVRELTMDERPRVLRW